jgi:hypothetical protein
MTRCPRRAGYVCVCVCGGLLRVCMCGGVDLYLPIYLPPYLPTDPRILIQGRGGERTKLDWTG